MQPREVNEILRRLGADQRMRNLYSHRNLASACPYGRKFSAEFPADRQMDPRIDPLALML